MKNEKIGFFDSGIGGISVLSYARNLLPYENFLYYADPAHVPYGTKTREQITEYSLQATEYLITHGAAAVVVACNTATSMAIETLRSSFDIPIIGIEPAVKPVALTHKNEDILVCATPVTIAGERLHSLIDRNFPPDSDRFPTLVALPELVCFAEQGEFNVDRICEYLSSKIDLTLHYSAVVLGCTHFSYFRDSFRKLLGNIDIVDGTKGTVNHLINTLNESGFNWKSGKTGSVEFVRSGDPVVSSNDIQFFEKLMKKSECQ